MITFRPTALCDIAPSAQAVRIHAIRCRKLRRPEVKPRPRRIRLRLLPHRQLDPIRANAACNSSAARPTEAAAASFGIGSGTTIWYFDFPLNPKIKSSSSEAALSLFGLVSCAKVAPGSSDASRRTVMMGWRTSHRFGTGIFQPISRRRSRPQESISLIPECQMSLT